MSGEDKLSFEQALARLEEVVKELEDGHLSLENSLKLFEEGIAVTRICERHLADAEQRLTLLSTDEQGNVHQQQLDSLTSLGNSLGTLLGD